MSTATNTQNDEIDLKEIWVALWGGRLLILGMAVAFAVLAAVVSLKMPNRYTAEVVLSPASDEENASSLLSSRIGGLASLAGFNPRAAMMDKTSIALEVLKSRAFIAEFINTHGYAAPLFAGAGWSIKKGKWIYNPDIYDAKTGEWVREVKPPKTPKPSDWELYNKFNRALAVEPDLKTGIVRVSFTSLSPTAASEWVGKLVMDLNSTMRQRDISDANKSITYLQQQLQKTSVTEMQKIFYQLIEQQTKKVMLAEVRDEYVFKVIDPATVPEEKSGPKRALIVLGATLGGGFIGMVIALIRHNTRKKTT